MSLDSFTEILGYLWSSRKRGGGRAPDAEDIVDDALEHSDTYRYLQPCGTMEARLTIVQITDVYTLDNFPSLKTMLQDIREKQGANEQDNKVVSMVRSFWFLFFLLKKNTSHSHLIYFTVSFHSSPETFWLPTC